MQNIQKFTIAGGNPTILIGGKSISAQLTSKYLKDAEQVGYINGRNLTMMGNELCINGTLAFASTLPKQGNLKTSGLQEKIYYTNTNINTIIKIPINYTRIQNLICLPGIAYIITNTRINNLKTYLAQLCSKYKVPAFGKIEYSGNRIVPFVYVKKINSLVPETSCGSGSLAYSIITGQENIIQPTGKTISIRQDLNLFSITAKVTKIQ